MKKFLPLLVFLLAVAPPRLTAQWPFSQGAVFVSVEGQVTVTDLQGKSRSVTKDSEALEGETVATAEDSQALLRFFDGSTLELKAGTRLVLAALKHPTDREKRLHFNLLGGLVRAVVKKLETASSLFEVEAGGVVCGVRGTQFSVAYDPAGERVDLKVAEGVVYARAGGQTYLLKAGEEKQFRDGRALLGLRPDPKSVAGGTAGQALGWGGVAPGALSLMDLNTQFVLGISVNGTRLAAAGPVATVASPSGISLGGVGAQPVVIGLPQLNPLQLGNLHLKIP